MPPLLKGRSTEAAAKRRDRTRRLSARRQQSRLDAQNSAPDPVLGYRSGNEAYWLNSELCQLILDREKVWGISDASATSTVSAPELSSGLDGAAGDAGRLESSPTLLNFGLTDDDRRLLEHDLAAVESQADEATPDEPNKASARQATLYSGREAAREAARVDQRDQLLRIIDLRNGDSGAIRGATARRIFQAFGSKQATPDRMDTGRAEVQSALLVLIRLTPQSPCSRRGSERCWSTSSSIRKSSWASARSTASCRRASGCVGTCGGDMRRATSRVSRGAASSGGRSRAR